MRVTSLVLRFAVVACMVLSWSRLAAADTTTRAEGLELTAPPGCIDATTFRTRLSALPVSAPHPVSLRSARIEVSLHEGTYEGALQLVLEDGTTVVRQVTAASCDEVTDALELVSALALGLDYTPPTPVKPPAALPVAPRAAPVRAVARWRFVGTLQGTVAGGAAPGLEVQPGLAVGAVLDAPSIVAPELDLEGMGGTGTVVPNTTLKANLTLASAALAGCPIRVTLGYGFALRPCAEVQLGALLGSGSGPHVVGSSPVQPWMAIAALGRVEWHAGRFFMLQVAGGIDVPALHDKYYFTPSTTVYTVPNAAGLARLGASVLWP